MTAFLTCQLSGQPVAQMSEPPVFEVFYPIKYFGYLIYFISYTIKKQLKNMATLVNM